MSDTTIQYIATVFPIDAEALKLDSKPRWSHSIIKEFSLNTSTHAILGIARSRSIQNRIFWSISLSIFIGIMLYFIIKVILVYFEYPPQTSIDIIIQWLQAFSAVTICNYSSLLYYQFIGPFIELYVLNLRQKLKTLFNFSFNYTQSD